MSKHIHLYSEEVKETKMTKVLNYIQENSSKGWMKVWDLAFAAFWLIYLLTK